MHKFKLVHIDTGESWDKEFTAESHPYQYDPYMTRWGFLELINHWNSGALGQSTVNASGKVEWLYIAL